MVLRGNKDQVVYVFVCLILRIKENPQLVVAYFFLVQTPAKAFWNFDQDKLISGARRLGASGREAID